MKKEDLIKLISKVDKRRCNCPNPYCQSRAEYDKAKGDIIEALSKEPAKILELKK